MVSRSWFQVSFEITGFHICLDVWEVMEVASELKMNAKHLPIPSTPTHPTGKPTRVG